MINFFSKKGIESDQKVDCEIILYLRIDEFLKRRKIEIHFIKLRARGAP